MIRLIKNNVLPGTFWSITILLFATYDMGVKSISALWHTDMWLLYTAVLGINGVFFMIGDNQIINKIAGMLLIGVLLFPVESLQPTHYSDWPIQSWLHHAFAIGFFITKSLNHRQYDWLIIIIGAPIFMCIGLTLYQTEFLGLYALLYTGYLKKRNYFKTYRTWINSR